MDLLNASSSSSARSVDLLNASSSSGSTDSIDRIAAISAAGGDTDTIAAAIHAPAAAAPSSGSRNLAAAQASNNTVASAGRDPFAPSAPRNPFASAAEERNRTAASATRSAHAIDTAIPVAHGTSSANQRRKTTDSSKKTSNMLHSLTRRAVSSVTSAAKVPNRSTSSNKRSDGRQETLIAKQESDAKNKESKKPRQKKSLIKKIAGTINSVSNLIHNSETKAYYSGDIEEFINNREKIVVSEVMSSAQEKNKFKKKSKLALQRPTDATKEDFNDARSHWAYKALSGKDSPLTRTGHVYFNRLRYYKSGDQHAEALLIAVVKSRLSNKKARAKRRQTCDELGITHEQLEEMNRSKRAEKISNLVVDQPKDLHGSGAYIAHTLRAVFNNDDRAVEALGQVVPWLSEKGYLKKFPSDQARMSYDGYIQKTPLLLSLGGADHCCMHVQGKKVDVTTRLAKMLQEIAKSKLSGDVLSGKLPRCKNYKMDWYRLTILSHAAYIYAAIGQHRKFFDLLDALPTGDALSEDSRESHLGSICHCCNNGSTTIADGMSPCVNPACLRFGTATCNFLDTHFFNAIIAVCNWSKIPDDKKRDYVRTRIQHYEYEVEARNGRHVDILIQKEERKRELEDFRATPTPAKAKELLKYFLPIDLPGYESLTPIIELEQEPTDDL